MPDVRHARFVRALVLLLSLVPVARAHAACSGFAAAASYAAGSAPQNVASGDFDGDGIADLAVACQTGAPLVILRGLGGGGFATPALYASGTAARALAVGDFNGDGRADIAECVSTGVAIWLGAGNGTFAGGTIFAAGSSPAGIACGDFDSDGIMDLAIASSITGCALVLHGRGADGVGDGTFDPPGMYAVGASPARLIAADLDGDGVLDLVVANNGGASVSVLRGVGAGGRGNGTFTAAVSFAVSGSPWGLAAIDWNRDGVPDLVVSNGAGTFVSLLRGTGSAAFVSAGTVTTPAAPRDLVAGDFDGDGIADVAAACAAANTVCVLHGTGSGFTALGNFATASGATGLAGGDWNGDGSPDLVCANAGAASVSRLLGTCPPSPTATVTLLAPLGSETWWPGTPQQVRWTHGTGVLAVDVELSRDGGHSWSAIARGITADHYDLLATGAPDPLLRARVRDAMMPSRVAASPADFTLCGVLAAPIVSDAGLDATHLATGDLDGDGLPDVVAADDTQVRVLRGDGHGHFTALGALAAVGTRQLALADADGDGLPDLLRASASGLGVLHGDGAGGFGPETLRVSADVAAFVAGDFDGDGVLDFAALAANGADARLLVARSGTPGAPWSMAVAGAPGALKAGDFNGDGIVDLTIGAGGMVRVMYGGGAASRGDGTFVPGPVRTLPSPPGDLAIADFDGDGTPDVLACLPATGDLVQLPITASGTDAGLPAFATSLVSGAGGASFSPLVADLDGDGRADVIEALLADHSVAVLRGAPGGFATPIRFAAGTCATALVIDDFTGDGLPDVVVAGTDGRLRCLPAQCPPRITATLALTAPADTAGACVGFARTIAWTRAVSVPAVRVELSRDGGRHWATLADGVVADDFTWIASGPATADARLRIRDASSGGRFDATARFAVRAPLGAPVSSTGLAAARALACAETSPGGGLDAVLADGARLQVLHADATGAFHELTRWSEPGARRVLLRDFDGDGLPELLALRPDALLLRRGLGAGAFGSAGILPLEQGAVDFLFGDFDEDGVADLATASGYGAAFRACVRRGLGAGADGLPTFAAPLYLALPALPTALAAADVDGDGILDLLAVHAGGLSVLRGGGGAGHGDGTFHNIGSRAFGAGDVRALIVADLDGDGRMDLAAADSAAGALLVSSGDGAGGFSAPAAISTSGAPLSLAIADIDRDGVTDMFVSLLNGDVQLLRGVAGAPLATRFVATGRITGGGAGGPLLLRDADGDAVADAIVADADGHLRVARGALAPAGTPRLAGGLPALAPLASELTVSWTKPPGVALVDLELTRDGGLHWDPVASGLGGPSFRWTVTGPYTGMARLRVRDANVAAAVDTAGPAFMIDPTVTGVAPTGAAALSLGAPWPNPAQGHVAFALALPVATRVRVDVFDVGGRRVLTLGDALFAAGTHTLRWSGLDAAGTPAPPGLYLVRAQARGFTGTRRIVRR